MTGDAFVEIFAFFLYIIDRTFAVIIKRFSTVRTIFKIVVRKALTAFTNHIWRLLVLLSPFVLTLYILFAFRGGIIVSAFLF